MNNQRFPYFLVLAGTLGMLLYPRFLPDAAPAYLHTDLAVGLVYGACIGLEILGLILLKRRQPRCA